MMNMKIRFRNKTFITTFVVVVLACVYNTLSMFDIVPKITQDQAQSIILEILNILAVMGIIIDPTTKGISDSDHVLEKGKKSKKDNQEKIDISKKTTKKSKKTK